MFGSLAHSKKAGILVRCPMVDKSYICTLGLQTPQGFTLKFTYQK